MKQQQTKSIQITESHVANFLKQKENQLKSYGGGFDVREFLRGAMIVIMDTPKLKKALKTEQGKANLYNALKHAASIGLSLNPLKKQACLIAYESKDGLQIDYQIMKDGYMQLALNSGKVEYITSFIVFENDEFNLSKSMAGDNYIFKPAKKDRGKIIGFMAALKTVSGIGHIKYMTKDEVNEIRDKYSIMYQKNKENSPWHKSYPGMGLKTVLKALFRSVSISQNLTEAIKTDEYFEFESVRNVTPGFTSEDVKEKLETKEKTEKTEKQDKQEKVENPQPKDLF